MRNQRPVSTSKRLLQRLLGFLGALGLAALLFMILPLLQVMGTRERTEVQAAGLETFQPPPPPPPPPEEEPPEPEPEEPLPELVEDFQPLDVSQLELALEPGLSDGWLGGDFTIDLNVLGSRSDAVDALFEGTELDQQPRPIYQAQPVITPEMRRKMPGSVYLILVVDESGRVVNPRVERSDDPVFDRAALKAIKQWKFEPGRSNGKPVSSPFRQPFTFSK